MVNVRDELTALIGSRLSAVWGAIYVERQQIVDEPALALWLQFDGQPLRGFKGAPDGEALLVIEEPPRPQDMGEAGEVIIRDLTARSAFARAAGSPLLGIWKLGSPGSRSPWGFRFDFGGLVKPMILNWGDQILVRLALPPDVRDDGVTEEPLINPRTAPRDG